MKKKGKIITGIIVGILGATMLTSCSVSAGQNAEIDTMLNKGNALIDSLDQMLNDRRSKEKAVDILDETRFNLKYLINGFEKFEINADMSVPQTGAKGNYKLVADFSTNKKQYYMEGGKLGETNKQINAYSYNVDSNVKAGYDYSNNVLIVQNETTINELLHRTTLETGYSYFRLFPEITAKNIIDFSKKNDTYIIKVKITETSENLTCYRSTYYITYKIKDNKFNEVSFTNLLETSETLSEEVDSFGNHYLNHPTLVQLYTITANFEYENDVDLAFLNNGISAIDARILSGDLQYKA